jgi:YHS domain-containing protein/putative intracellular protease/amidase
MLEASAMFGALSVAPGLMPAMFGQDAKPAAKKLSGPGLNAFKAPVKESIPVAFAISKGAVLIDFAGPWEVFSNTMVPGNDNPFRLYTVAEKAAAIEASGGMMVEPNYTFQNAPAPKVIVIPAQGGVTDSMIKWIRESSKAADLTMSVCTGSFVLAQTGLLSGKSATTHHTAYTDFQMRYPDIRVIRGSRFVEEGNIATAGGLTSGMDLAMRVVERYFGKQVAENTAFQLEYQGVGWKDDTGASNAQYNKMAQGLVCPVCGMEVEKVEKLRSDYKGKAYYFCMVDHKQLFDKDPEKVLALSSEN